MADTWNLADAKADDLFEAAVAIEQGGIDFYERLRSGHADPRVKKELELLRDEETRHKDLFLSFLRARPAGARGDRPSGQTSKGSLRKSSGISSGSCSCVPTTELGSSGERCRLPR